MRYLVLAALAAMSCANQDAPLSPAPKKPESGAPVAAAEEPEDDAGLGKLGARKPKFEVWFSPKGGCTDHVVAFILSAKTEVLVEAYSFTSKPIAEALVQVSKKASVKVILDSEENQNRAGKTILVAGGVSVVTDAKHPIFHDKVVIVDQKAVEMGSFNYTAQAENGNAENCNIVRDADVAAKYVENWKLHASHSVPVPPGYLDAGAPEAGARFR